MTECDHPAPNQDRILPGSRIGEYVVQIGRDLALGPIPNDKIEEAHRLCHEDTGANSRTVRLGDKQCPKCGVWWSETSISPARPDDNVADDLLST
jgi:hypothetical protein